MSAAYPQVPAEISVKAVLEIGPVDFQSFFVLYNATDERRGDGALANVRNAT